MEEQLKTLFMELIQFTKNVSPEIWAILVKQQLIYGITNLTVLITSGILFVGGLLASKKRGWKESGPTLPNVIAIIGGVFLFIALIFFSVDGVSQLLNPEYHALMSLKP